MINNSHQELLLHSEDIWNKVLKKQDRRYRLSLKGFLQEKFPNENIDVLLEKIRTPDDVKNGKKDEINSILLFSRRYSDFINFSESKVTLNTDDFIYLILDFAEEVGIDLRLFANKLTGQKEASEYTVGIAFRTVFEVEGYYKEYPYASTEYQVPKKFLIILGAALIGVTTAKVSQMDTVLAGSASGAGSLLINILAERYANETEPKVNWLEEFVLQVLEKYGIQSFNELRRVTNIDSELLKKVLNDLKKKNLIEENKSWIDKTDLKYDLRGRHW